MIYTSNGFALAQLERWDEALASYRNAALADPADPITFQNIAHLCSTLGQQDGAIAALERALSIDPSSPSLKSELVNALLAAGRSKDASDRIAEWSQGDETKSFSRAHQTGIIRLDDDIVARNSEIDSLMQKEEGRNGFRPHHQLAITQAAQAPMPLDIVAICSSLDVDVYFADWGKNQSVMGEVIEDCGRWSIFVNEMLRTEWIRSTIAEELYRVLEARDAGVEARLQDASGTDSIADSQARRFAEAMLMPDNRVRELVELIDDRNALAAAFDVPRAQLERRLQQLELVGEDGSYVRPTRDADRTIGSPQAIDLGPGSLAPK